MTIDKGIADKRLLVVESELASTFRVARRDGNTLSPLLRLAWDGTDLRTLTKNSPQVATSPHIGIIGHITRDELVNVLDGTEAANGLLNRFLWVCMRRSKLLPDGGSLPPYALEDLGRRAAGALEFSRNVGVVERTPKAQELWRKLYPELSSDVPGLLGAVTARAEAQVVRISVIYAMLDRSPVVTVEHLNAAVAIWTYCAASARFIFGQRLGDAVLDTIWDALRNNPGGLTRTEIRDLFGRHQSGERIETALARLMQMGLARSETTTTAGRPGERWVCT